MYRDELEAMRRRLSATEAELSRTRETLRRATGRDERAERLANDPVLQTARAVLWGVPVVYVGGALLYYGLSVALLGLGRDGLPFVTLLLAVLAPLPVLSGAASLGLKHGKRAAWVMGVLAFGWLSLLMPPLGVFGLYALLRARCRTVLFPPPSEPRVRVQTNIETDIQPGAEQRLEVEAVREEREVRHEHGASPPAGPREP